MLSAVTIPTEDPGEAAYGEGCPDGYVRGDDDQCHLVETTAPGEITSTATGKLPAARPRVGGGALSLIALVGALAGGAIAYWGTR